LKQKYRHQPDKGIYGDCHRAAIASVLELPLEAVPHFAEGGVSADEFNRRCDAYLASLNVRLVSLPFQQELDQVLSAMAAFASEDTVYLLGGTSLTGVNHTVVCQGAKIVHDPALNSSGIVGPCSDGYYWVSFFTVLKPEALATARPAIRRRKAA
jgi:hypothetical protein